MALIEVENLSKTYRTFERKPGIRGAIVNFFHRDYRDVRAVENVSFTIDAGELVGYIGPNGAGKSTTIKMLTGILVPTAGHIRVSGFEPARERREYTRHIGVVFGQRTQLWWDIAVRESFRLLQKIYRVPESDFRDRMEKFNEVLDIEPLLSVPVRKLSLGQRMRCDLAASLLHAPRIVFLDEPTIGLDILGRQHIRDFLEFINRETETTIILTTHNLDEIERLCRRVIIIDRGALLYDGSLERLKNRYSGERTVIFHLREPVPEERQKDVRAALPALDGTFANEHELAVPLRSADLSMPDLVEKVAAKLRIRDMVIREPLIDDIIARIYREGSIR